jgi:hypothetical protein
MLIFVKLVQLQKALASILVILFGSTTSVTLLQLYKQPNGRAVNPLPKTAFTRHDILEGKLDDRPLGFNPIILQVYCPAVV